MVLILGIVAKGLRFRPAVWARTLFLLLAGGGAFLMSIPASAQDILPSGGGGDTVTSCVLSADVTFYAAPSVVALGQSTTLHWAVKGCSDAHVSISGIGRVALSGSTTIMPAVTGDLSLSLQEDLPLNGGSAFAVRASVHLTMTSPVMVNGRATITINDNSQKDLFIQAIQTPNTTVVLADNLDLDLSGFEYVEIAPGVHILGGRSSTKLGPRLFTTSRPHQLFTIGAHTPADGVRISGIRLDGGLSGSIADDDSATVSGITVYSSINVEVGNNEIYGWSGEAVCAQDKDDTPIGRINLTNPTAVWVHDNYIHHNRRWRAEGYGVQSTHGAYVLIERNVFDYNRHAIEAGGNPLTGYLAYNNLLLENGGENFNFGTYTQYTHEFDVHGTQPGPLGQDAYGGPAGEYFEYRNNTLTYTSGDALKVRGYPSISAEVFHNVFSVSQDDAITQTDGNNLHQGDNQFNVFPFAGGDNVVYGDFDGDGILDLFIATGVTWWYRSGATSQWHYLNTSKKLNADILEFADFNKDGRTDVKLKGTTEAERLVFSGGGPKRLMTATHPQGVETAPKIANVFWQPGGLEDVKGWQLRNGKVAASLNLSILDRVFLGSGDFNGDGVPDLVLRDPAGQVFLLLLNESAGLFLAVPQSTWVHSRGTTLLSTQMAGIGDFNGDGRSDVLWRRDDGQLEIWFAGDQGNSALVSYNNVTDKPDPVSSTWQVKGIGDFNGDGCSDILWRDDTGQVSIWYMEHSVRIGEIQPGGPDSAHQWEVQGVGDFDGDGHADILWRNIEGRLSIQFEGLFEIPQAFPTYGNTPGALVSPDWRIQAVGDFNDDGLADILFRSDSTGAASIWTMDGGRFLANWGGVAAKVLMNPAVNRASVVGQAVSWKFTGVYGVPPYTWSATGLPNGILLDATTGAYTGTLTQAGLNTVTCGVTDQGGFTSTGAFTWTVTPPVVFTSVANTADLVGSVIHRQFAATNGKTPYSWSATGLPNGISLDSATGTYGGAPTQPGISHVTFTVTDGIGGTSTGSFDWTVTPMTVPVVSFPTSYALDTASGQFTVSGGNAPYTWSVTGLPPGITLGDAATGAYSGSLTQAGTFTVVRTVTDRNGLSATGSSSWVVVNSPSVAFIADRTDALGSSPTGQFSATNGVAPYAWTASGLPSGVALSASGALSGTLTTAGTFSVTATATDHNGRIATRSFKWTVPGFAVNNISPRTTNLGNTAGGQFAATGGVTPYAWSATGLPPGIPLNATTGYYYGTTTQAGTFNVVVTATDQNGITAVRSFSWVVLAPLTVAPFSFSGDSVGDAAQYSVAVFVSGGTSPYTYSAANLPPGIVINATTGAVTGTFSQYGTYSTTITVTDLKGNKVSRSFSWTVYS